MENAKEKTTNFLKKHKVGLMVAGGIAGGYLLLKQTFGLGFRCGTHATLTYLDAKLPELELSRHYMELVGFQG